MAAERLYLVRSLEKKCRRAEMSLEDLSPNEVAEIFTSSLLQSQFEWLYPKQFPDRIE